MDAMSGPLDAGGGMAPLIEALHEAQVLALRQISENLAAQTKRLEGLTSKVDDVRERLARLEAQEAGKLVETLRGELRSALTRIDVLEAQRDRVAGVATFSTWLARSGPWFAAGVAAFLAGLGLRAAT
jgi:chromosome segregation ATPase